MSRTHGTTRSIAKKVYSCKILRDSTLSDSEEDTWIPSFSALMDQASSLPTKRISNHNPGRREIITRSESATWATNAPILLWHSWSRKQPNKRLCMGATLRGLWTLLKNLWRRENVSRGISAMVEVQKIVLDLSPWGWSYHDTTVFFSISLAPMEAKSLLFAFFILDRLLHCSADQTRLNYDLTTLLT